MAKRVGKRFWPTLAQNLRPEGIFAINRVLAEIQDELEPEYPEVMSSQTLVISPVVFDKFTRTFHTAAILGDGRGPPDGEGEARDGSLQAAKSMLFKTADLFAEFTKAKAYLSRGPSYVDATQYVEGIVDQIKNGKNRKWQFSRGNSEHQRQFFESLQTLYYGIKSHRELYVAGILYRELKRYARSFDFGYFKARPLPGKNDEPLDYQGRSYQRSREPISRECNIHRQIEILIDDRSQQYALSEVGRGSRFLFELMNFFYVEEFRRRAKENGVPEQGPVLLLPVRDTWLEGKDYGGLSACLICTFRDEEVLERFEKTALAQFSRRCEAICDALFDAGLASIEGGEIAPPYDLVEHFVRALGYVHDWQNVTVYRKGQESKPIFCYRRREPGDDISADEDWIRCDRGLFGNAHGCDALPSIDLIQCNGGDCLAVHTEKERENRILRWTDRGFDIWQTRLVPELGEEERSAYSDFTLAFEFPQTASIPDEGDWREFSTAIFRQQIEVLRILVPKVRAQRYALRTAATAIMGRNMSHNIGSHVLARYASKIGKEQPVSGGKADHRGDFLAYLQRRMDFLAEAATSDRAFWSQPLSLREQLSRLNYEAQSEQYQTNEQPKREPILLSYIAGKETLKANVRLEGLASDADVWFACPSGEVGVHALFVILENIIRNSARHGNGSGGMVDISVHVGRGNSPDGLWRLEIVDPRSMWKKEEESVSDRINGIIRNEQFLDASGQPNPRNWGLREMQICAHYLRGFALSDLEGPWRSEHPVLEAAAERVNGTEFCLKYSLFLERARLMAAVVKAGGGFGHEPAKLEQRGVLVLDVEGAQPDWNVIADKIRGHSFLVVEKGIGFPSRDQRELGASLPVRKFKLGQDEIGQHIQSAVDNNGGLQWMEPLHKRWAEICRDRHTAWEDLTMWGVAVARNDGFKLSGSDDVPTDDDSEGRLFRVTEGDGRSNVRPLPASAEHWVRTLQTKAIAAVWVDHLSEPDVRFDNAKLLQAAKPKGDETARRRWISVETVNGDSPHRPYLEASTAGSGWEIIAAAVPRVAVLDERVQSEWDKTFRGGIALATVWSLMGVWVPAKEKCNLDSPFFDTCQQFLRKPTEDHIEHYPVDFLIVHLTILERLKKEKRLSLQETLAELVSETAAKDSEIIVVTGRGVPTAARAFDRDGDERIEGARYLPISALLESLVSRPSKLALMRALWSAGRPGARDT